MIRCWASRSRTTSTAPSPTFPRAILPSCVPRWSPPEHWHASHAPWGWDPTSGSARASCKPREPIRTPSWRDTMETLIGAAYTLTTSIEVARQLIAYAADPAAPRQRGDDRSARTGRPPFRRLPPRIASVTSVMSSPNPAPIMTRRSARCSPSLTPTPTAPDPARPRRTPNVRRPESPSRHPHRWSG